MRSIGRLRDAADSGIPGVFGRLLLFLKRAAKNQVHGSLCVGSGMNDEAVILFQLFDPVLDVCGGVLVSNASDSAKKGCAHLRYQFLFAVTLISEAAAKGAIETVLVAGAVSERQPDAQASCSSRQYQLNWRDMM